MPWDLLKGVQVPPPGAPTEDEDPMKGPRWKEGTLNGNTEQGSSPPSLLSYKKHNIHCLVLLFKRNTLVFIYFSHVSFCSTLDFQILTCVCVCVFQGDYVRRWVPELQGLGGGEVHAPWNLGPSALNHAQVTLGTSYPHPVVMAPEWSRHTGRKAGGRQVSGSELRVRAYIES